MNLLIREATDADWSTVCEKEKIINPARLVNVYKLLQEIKRTDE